MHGARPAVRCPAKLIGTPGQVIKIKRGGKGLSNNSGSKDKRHYTAILAENAMALGWLNGHRIRKGVNNVEK